MNNKLIQIFARNPKPGKVKTRLIPDIGKTAAYKVYKQILSKIIENTNLNNIKSEIWITDRDFSKFKDEIKFNNNMQPHEQKGNNLGERMFIAMQSGLDRANKIALIGSDYPATNK